MIKGETLEQRKARYLEKIKAFRLIDDDFMRVIFKSKKNTELLLQIVLMRTDLKIIDITTQSDMKNLKGRSVVLDILAVDSEGRLYNIEIQRSNKGGGILRARYNSSLMDANVTDPGDEFEKLPETYTIFITENDILGGNLPIYHVESIIEELSKPVGDKRHIIYVNSTIQDPETDLGRLMHDFYCTEASKMFYKELADDVRYFKEDEKGVNNMCEIMEELANEAKKENSMQIALTLISMGKMSLEEIAKATELSLEEVRELAGEKSA